MKGPWRIRVSSESVSFKQNGIVMDPPELSSL